MYIEYQIFSFFFHCELLKWKYFDIGLDFQESMTQVNTLQKPSFVGNFPGSAKGLTGCPWARY